jgi:hypothetical protein
MRIDVLADPLVAGSAIGFFFDGGAVRFATPAAVLFMDWRPDCSVRRTRYELL